MCRDGNHTRPAPNGAGFFQFFWVTGRVRGEKLKSQLGSGRVRGSNGPPRTCPDLYIYTPAIT